MRLSLLVATIAFAVLPGALGREDYIPQGKCVPPVIYEGKPAGRMIDVNGSKLSSWKIP